MEFANFLQVHVDNLASLEVLVEKGANHVVGLGHGGQELLFGDLLVVAVAEGEVRALLLVFEFSGRNTLLCHRTH